MDLLEDVGPDHGVEVRLHVVEYDVDVLVVVGADVVELLDDVLVVQLREEDDLAEGPLGIGGVVEGIEDLLHRHNLVPLPVYRLSDHSVGPLAQLSDDLVLLKDMGLDLLGVAHLDGSVPMSFLATPWIF